MSEIHDKKESKQLLLLAIRYGVLHSYGEGLEMVTGAYWKKGRPMHYINFVASGELSYKVHVEYLPRWMAGSFSIFDKYWLPEWIKFSIICLTDGHTVSGYMNGDYCDEVVTALEDKFGIMLSRIES